MAIHISAEQLDLLFTKEEAIKLTPEEIRRNLRFVKKLGKRVSKEQVELQKAIESQFCKNQRFNIILDDVGENPAFLRQCILAECTEEESEKAAIFVMHTLQHKKADPGVLASLMKGHFNGSRDEAASFVENCIDCGFAIEEWTEDGALIHPSPLFELRLETKQRLEGLADMGPMILPPMRATNKHSGYLTVDAGPFVLNFKDYNREGDFCIEISNRAMQTAHTLDVIQCQWVMNHFGELNQRKEGESYGDWILRKNALAKFKRNLERYVELYSKHPFYYLRNVSCSGREFYKSFVLNPAGQPWQKSIIDLEGAEILSEEIIKVPWADPEFKQFDGWQYLQMAIAAAYDTNDGVEMDLSLGKCPHSVMLNWFARHEKDLFTAEFLQGAKQKNKPELMKLLRVYAEALEGKPIRCVFSLDGTASGPQDLSAMFRDPYTAELTNVIPGRKGDWRYNIYTETFENIVQLLGGEKFQVEYEQWKKAVMTSYYSSEAKPKECMGTDPLEQDPNNFSREYKAFLKTMEEKTPLVWAINIAVKNAWNPKATRYSWMMPDGFEVTFPVMVHMKAEVNYRGNSYTTEYNEEGTKKVGKSLMANLAHSVDSMVKREMERRLNYDPKVIGFVKAVLAGKVKNYKTSAHTMKIAEKLFHLYNVTEFRTWRWLHFVTPDTIDRFFDREMVQRMIDMLPPKPIPFISIFDDFRAHPNYGNWVRAVYNEIQNDMNKSKAGPFLLRQISPKFANFKLGPDFGDEPRKANYSLSV